MSDKKVENTIPVLSVSDLATSIEFYADLLGFVIDWQTDGIASVSRDEHSIMLSESRPVIKPAWVWIGLRESSPFDQYKALGVKVYQEPENHSWAYEMKFEDPDGNVLWLGTETRDDLPVMDQL